ncbi:MAG: Na/Pi cotransporter family protein [Bacteroidales bacterium]|nr:Na/Pi cotransporter family protein [Bacteroidales bacterium]
MNTVLQILTLLGAVTLFLFGLSLLSGGLQKVAGSGLRSFLAKMTSNPFKQIITGIGITAIIQSSTATTIMVVSFVNAGLLVLGQAIGVIMGAHIGTTITSWIMAVFGFSFNMADFAYPLILLGFVLRQNKKNQRYRDVGEIIIGFALFFIGFAQLRATAQSLITPESLGFLSGWTQHGGWSVALFLLIGIVLTVCFQSSAATMAIIMILVTTGVIPFKLAAAMILGENIGTTIAANIAASVGNTAAKRTAISHTVINTFGVCWVLCIFPFWLKAVGQIVTLFGLPDPNTADLTDAANAEAISTSLLYSVCTMHTLFNLVNTLLLVWFIPQIVKVVKLIFPDKEEEEVFRLKYISAGTISTADMAISGVKMELVRYGDICRKDLGYIRRAIAARTREDFEKANESLIKYEEITDHFEHEIADYLNEVTRNETGHESNLRIRSFYRIIGEMESLGDSGEGIGKILSRAWAHDKVPNEEMVSKLDRMIDLVDSAYEAMHNNLDTPLVSLPDIVNAEEAEARINACRDMLREEHLSKVEQSSYAYETGAFYMDIVNALEKMGDFIINISQAQFSAKPLR